MDKQKRKVGNVFKCDDIQMIAIGTLAIKRKKYSRGMKNMKQTQEYVYTIQINVIEVKVHVNGRLPLITSSIVEYANGDEVVAKLVYENLERHCSKCFRLDHELRDCLQAKAEKREQLKEKEKEEESLTHRNRSPRRNDRDDHRMGTRGEAGQDRHYSPNPHHQKGNYISGRSNQEADWSRRSYGHQNHSERQRRDDRDDYAKRPQLPHHRQSHSRDLSKERPSHTSVYREVRTQAQPRPTSPTGRISSDKTPVNHRLEIGGSRAESTNSKETHRTSDRGIPLQSSHQDLPREAVAKAIEEVHDAMIQYTLCADPTERAARRERFRQAEAQGEIEETAVNIVRASLAAQTGINEETETLTSPPRTSALLRLGPSPTPPDQPSQSELPQQPSTATRRKPGRPPGGKKVQTSPKTLAGASSRKRKVQQSKNPSCKRNISMAGEKEPPNRATSTRQRKAKAKGDVGNSLDSNQPICNLIPATTKRKKTDFQTPSTLVP
ncbi:DUF4283 domain-containing protein [Raphanus sativus]|uniref:Uncharacterized protein LOC130495494 n=1 Tax=Raphanus sativus TaxID=3726 RepID=A0A9W3BUF9_RAPSA|nr:uncharacterized protein LOC130495494 [Raphanus sativus]KAJ4887179.1 DUF4283 domain-containing protein [Raphanus sativus]